MPHRSVGHQPAPTADTSAGGNAPPHGGLMMFLLALAQFMVILDVTVVNVALPDIGASLGLDRASLTTVVTSYITAFGSLLILGGRLADAWGRKAMFLAGLVLFTAASVASGLATGGTVLLVSRVVQGVGAAMLSPSALSILTTEFTGRDRHRVLGVWGAVGGAGAAVGVLVGGLLTSGPGWRWAFLINVPAGLIVLVGVLLVVPARRPTPARVDIPGAIAGTTAVGLLIYALTRAGDVGWGSWRVLLPLAASVVGFLVFLAIERRAAAPLVPLPLLRRPPLPGPAAVMLSGSVILMSTFFLMSVYLQRVREFSALETGLLFLPVAVAAGLGAHLSAQLIAKTGARPVAATGLGLASAGLLVLGVAGNAVDSHVWLVDLPAFMAMSLGIGATFVTATVSALTAVDHERAGLASGILNTGHELGGSLGIAVVSTVAATGIATGSTAGFGPAFLLVAGVGAVLAVLAASVLLPPGRPVMPDEPMLMH